MLTLWLVSVRRYLRVALRLDGWEVDMVGSLTSGQMEDAVSSSSNSSRLKKNGTCDSKILIVRRITRQFPEISSVLPTIGCLTLLATR